MYLRGQGFMRKKKPNVKTENEQKKITTFENVLKRERKQLELFLQVLRNNRFVK